MAIRILSLSLEDTDSYRPILERGREDLSSAMEAVIPLVEDIRKRGDEAVREYTRKFDSFLPDRWVWDPSEIDTDSLPALLKEGFRISYENIYEFHKNQIPKDWTTEIRGNSLGVRYCPVDSVTVYAPGGTALYPSSVLMGTIPAKIAGVKHIRIATPPQKDGIPPILAYVANLVGVRQILTIGGAQAIAACAFGTETIPRSDFIVGPGNRYVAAAKMYLFGQGVIGMESPAGPSDVMVVADETANPEWVACDLLSQAEHGSDSVAILATPSRELIQNTAEEIEKAFRTRTKRLEMKKKAIEENSYLLHFPNLNECLEFANLFAPEHLEIITCNPEKDFQKIRHAGSVFLGAYSPVAMGDYISGTNHILPTSGAARLYSSLGVDTFLKRITYQKVTPESIRELYPYVKAMSESEGLEEEHGHSVYLRTLSDSSQSYSK